MSITKKNVFGSIPLPVRAKPTLLGGDPKGDNILYCVGNSVVIRNLRNPLETELYTDHTTTTTVARYSPSRFYIASADTSGTVRIWDTTQAEHILKIELKIIHGPILDLDWSEDSKRIVAVGEGKEKFGAVVAFDTGASVGEITGHSKPITTCHFKPNRPYRLVTGSEDFQTNWFEGPPFKFKKTNRDHQRFVNCVRFNPTGTVYISAGSDKKAFVYDGKEGNKIGELGDDKTGHQGSVMTLSFNKEGTQVITSSADKTVKLWDVNTMQCISTFKFGNGTEDQQLGCLWQNEFLVSLSGNGDLNYLDVNSPDKPSKTIKGHNKFITSLAADESGSHFYTGSYDGVVNRWDSISGWADPFTGKGHTNSVQAMHVQGDNLITASLDDTVRATPLSSRAYSEAKVALKGQPSDVAVGRKNKDLSIAATNNGVFVISKGQVASSVATANASAVAINNDDSVVVVGYKDNSLVVYSLSGTNLTEKRKLTGHRGAVTRVAFSPDGKHFASCDSNREILAWAVDGSAPVVSGWVFHTARVNDISWSPDNNHLASVSLDQNIFIWDVSNPDKRIQFKGAHQGGVNSVRWLNYNTLVTVGQDCCAKTWNVAY